MSDFSDFLFYEYFVDGVKHHLCDSNCFFYTRYDVSNGVMRGLSRWKKTKNLKIIGDSLLRGGKYYHLYKLDVTPGEFGFPTKRLFL